MKIELELNDDEIILLKCAINLSIYKCDGFLCDEFANEEKKDDVKKEKVMLCNLFTKINEQTKKRISW